MALCGLWHGPSWTFVLWGTAAWRRGWSTVSLWRRYGWRDARARRLGADVVFAHAHARASSAPARSRPHGTSIRGLRSCRTSSAVGRALPIIVAGLVAFTLPASQDIVAWLNERPRKVVAAALGLVVVAVLVELGDREAYEFVYFQF